MQYINITGRFIHIQTLFANLGPRLLSDLIFPPSPLILLLNWQTSLVLCLLTRHRVVRFLFLALQARKRVRISRPLPFPSLGLILRFTRPQPLHILRFFNLLPYRLLRRLDAGLRGLLQSRRAVVEVQHRGPRHLPRPLPQLGELRRHEIALRVPAGDHGADALGRRPPLLLGVAVAALVQGELLQDLGGDSIEHFQL